MLVWLGLPLPASGEIGRAEYVSPEELKRYALESA
jgi:hypothetical protein